MRKLIILAAFGMAAILLLTMFPVFALGSSPINQAQTDTAIPNVGGREQPGFGESLVQDLKISPEEISLNLLIPEVNVIDGFVEAYGLAARTQEPGSPDLPYFTTLIALPPGGIARVNVEAIEVDRMTGVSVNPAPERSIEGEISVNPSDFASPEDLRLHTKPNLSVYSDDAIFPKVSYTLSEPFYLRDLRLVQLSIFPVRYIPASRELIHSSNMALSISIDGPPAGVDQPGISQSVGYHDGYSELILNYDQVAGWQGFPDDFSSTSTNLPVGQDVFKIEISQDGIYELSYDDLEVAGMDVDSVDPNTFQMLYRGNSVAYEFVGDADQSFEDGELVRFFGWAFDGSRLERQFLVNNVLWLWAGGTRSEVSSIASQSRPQASSFMESVTEEQENFWFPTLTDLWSQFPNEPDAWYWSKLSKPDSAPITQTFAVTLPLPSPSGPNASFTAEFTSRTSTVVGGNSVPHSVRISLNDIAPEALGSWIGKQNVNITGTVPLASILDGSNATRIVLDTASLDGGVYLNRITVDYMRQLVATDDQLILRDEVGGREFGITGYSQNGANNIIVWNISDPANPIAYDPQSITVTGPGPYKYTFGGTHPADSRFIATTAANALDPVSVSRYVPPDLDPPGNGADWVAIAHPIFLTETQRLGDHRADPTFGGYSTHIVDVNDVINQYGYGLPIPKAIRDYMIHALGTWQIPPIYLALIGDATIDPRGIDAGWNDQQFLPVDMPFVDRFQGQIPSDHVYSLLVGNDLVSDIAVGRISVQNEAHITSAVNKIIQYDQNQLFPSGFLENMLFVSDDTDLAGNFCDENVEVGNFFPSVFNQTHLCLPDNPTTQDGEDLRDEMFRQLNDVGSLIMNYRGHGAVNYWGGNPVIMSTGDGTRWTNTSKPVVIITGDCLDAFFAYPPSEGLGETFLRATQGGGSSAHWSSSGLGFPDEHSLMIESFYEGLFTAGTTAIGDAARYAKVKYSLFGGHPSNLYSFTLLGDPAMELMRPALSVTKNSLQDEAEVGENVDFLITAANNGLYPSNVTITDTLPEGLVYVSADSTVSGTISTSGRDVIFDLQFGDTLRDYGMPLGATATITLSAQVAPWAPGGEVTNFVAIGGPGLELMPGDESDSDIIDIILKMLLPLLHK